MHSTDSTTNTYLAPSAAVPKLEDSVFRNNRDKSIKHHKLWKQKYKEINVISLFLHGKNSSSMSKENFSTSFCLKKPLSMKKNHLYLRQYKSRNTHIFIPLRVAIYFCVKLRHLLLPGKVVQCCLFRLVPLLLWMLEAAGIDCFLKNFQHVLTIDSCYQMCTFNCVYRLMFFPFIRAGLEIKWSWKVA